MSPYPKPYSKGGQLYIPQLYVPPALCSPSSIFPQLYVPPALCSPMVKLIRPSPEGGRDVVLGVCVSVTMLSPPFLNKSQPDLDDTLYDGSTLWNITHVYVSLSVSVRHTFV